MEGRGARVSVIAMQQGKANRGERSERGAKMPNIYGRRQLDFYLRPKLIMGLFGLNHLDF